MQIDPNNVQWDAPHPANITWDNAEQPGVIDKIVGSPIGRLAHDAVAQPLEAAAQFGAKYMPFGNQGAADLVGKANSAIENAYQGSLQRNQNTHGYVAARQQADKVVASLPNPGGFTQQVTALFNPSIAGLGSLLLSGGNLDQANAAADSQAAAQAAYQKAHPISSFLGQRIGGLAATPENVNLPLVLKNTSQQAAKPFVPTLNDLNQAKQAAYSVVDNSPMHISQQAVSDLHQSVKDALQKQFGLTDSTIDRLTPKTSAALDSLGEAAQTGQTLQGLDNQRKVAGIAASSIDKTDRAAARLMQDKIDDFIGNLQPSQLVGPTDQAAIDALPEARSLAQRSFKAQMVQDAMNKAALRAQGPGVMGTDSALRTQFRKMAENPRAMARFTPSEQDAISRVATGGSWGSVNNILRGIGKFSPLNAIAGPVEAGTYLASGLNPSALALPAAGLAGKAGANMMTKAAANRALSTVLAGPGAAPLASPGLLATPSLANAAIPYGLIGSTAYGMAPAY